VRTVTFSDPQVRDLLKEFFVCTWRNLEGDPQAGGSPRIREGDAPLPLPRGSGYPNLQILIFTPDARLLHVMLGAIGAEDMKWGLAQALITHEAARAKPDSAKRVVSWRQDGIQEQLVGKKTRSASRGFRIQPGARKNTAATAAPSDRVRRHTARERKVVKRHPLAPEHKIQTRWLTEGNTGAGFARDGKILDAPEGAYRRTRRVLPQRSVRPLPWADMPEDLRTRFAKALGVTPPAVPPAVPPGVPPAVPAGKSSPRRSK